MKTSVKAILFFLCAALVTACSSNNTRSQEGEQSLTRKIYLTEQDYLDELGEEAEKERREAPPAAESEYIFNAVPETDKAIYFFDERQQPKVPGQPSAADYKKEKRLWQKPKRYTPEEYYGMQGDSSSSETSSSEESYDY
ncbi:MAG: hypothetical protein IKO35_05725 [Elusimicrobiaceae bacterium]|nr:hypothetical protein [Elusimicrobiaceae bacterium]